MAVLIVGVFRERSQTECAVRELRNHGFPASDVGLAIHGGGTQTAATAQASGQGTFNWVPNHRVSTLQGIGNAFVAGTVANCIDREFPGQAQPSLAAALACMGVRREHADWYDQKVREGNDLVVVCTDSRGAEAETMMEQCGTLEVPSGARTTNVTRPPMGSSSALSTSAMAGQPSSSASRTSQGAVTDFSQVKAGFDVFTSDGQRIGTVQEASPQCVHVLCCSNMFVPPTRVASVTTDSIVLNLPENQLGNVDWSTCQPSHQQEYQSGGPGYSGLSPREHEDGTHIPVDTDNG